MRCGKSAFVTVGKHGWELSLIYGVTGKVSRAAPLREGLCG